MSKVRALNSEKVVIIEPDDLEEITIPLFCPLCEFPMKTREDVSSYRKHKLCERCDYRWFNKPDVEKTSSEWKEYIEYRLLVNRPIFNLE